jgi:hypothetical protein
MADATPQSLRCLPAPFERVDQLCFLVDDIDTAIANYSGLFGATSWRAYRYAPDTLPRLGFRDGPGEFSMWVALSDCVPQVELIQSINGPSIYTEWIDRHGLGFHHLGFFRESIAADLASPALAGLTVSQTGGGYGLDGDGGFAYLDSLERYGAIIELIEIPTRRRTPDREWQITRPGLTT